MATSDVLPIIGAVTGSFGALAGGLSLGWNVASYLLSGGRAKVRMGVGLFSGGELFLMPIRKQGVNIYDNPLGGPAETALVIRIDGKGRQAMTITGVELVGRSGFSYPPMKFLRGKPPVRLDVYDSHTVVLPLRDVNLRVHEALRRSSKKKLRLRIAVRFGNGKIRYGKSLRFYVGTDPQLVSGGESPNQAE